MGDDVVFIRVSKQLFERFAGRDLECNRLTVAWEGSDAVGLYTPIVTTHYEDNPLRLLREAITRAYGEREAEVLFGTGESEPPGRIHGGERSGG